MKTQTEHAHPSKIQRRVGTVLTTLIVLMLVASAGTKLAHVPSVVSQLAAIGITGARLTFVAALELLSALLFLIPATRSIGLLLISAFLGGAIATHLQHGQSIVGPSFVLGVAWFGACIRHPEILWSWSQKGPRSAFRGANGMEQMRAIGEVR